MVRRIIIIAISLFAFNNIMGQTGMISGKVSSNKAAVEFASIGLKNTSIGSFTNADGSFEIKDIPFGKYRLFVSVIGYKPQTKEVVINSGNTTHKIDFSLVESTTTLESVVISGTMKEVSKLESPVNVEVYSPQFFKANPTPSIFESMQNVNGVRPQLNCNVCNTGDIHINGLEGPYTMVMIDGMPIVSGLSTVYGLTGIPQSLIERVEIVKGPASTLYGSEAVGGLINIITKKPLTAPVFSADVFSSSWGEVNTDLGWKFKAGKKAHSLVGVNYFNYQNPIDNNDDNFTDVTLQNRISVFNKWTFNRKNNRVFNIAGRYVYEDRWGGEMNWEKKYRGGDQIYGESIYTSRWEAFGTYQLPVDEAINFQFSANGHQQNSVYGTTVYIADQYIGFGQLTWNKEVGGSHDILMGAAFRYTYYDDNTTATEDGDENDPSLTYLPGLFIQDEISLNTNNKLLLGMRYDYNSRHGNIFTPRLNYKWNSQDKKNVFRLSIGNGYRVANVFTEDHAALTGSRDVVFEGKLEPERSWNANVNYVKKIYTGNNTFIGLDASAFYTRFNNRIIPDYETDVQKIIYRNLDGHAVSQGVSLNAELVTDWGLKVMAGATFMDVSIVEEGERFQQLLTEEISGVWSVGYTFEKIGLTVDYTGNVYGPMRLPLLGINDKRPEFSPTWSLQNIQFTKKIRNSWEIYAGIKNLLNYTPPANSISRPFDPFDNDVDETDPNALTFDPSYVFAPNQGIRGFFGVRHTLRR